MKVQIDSTGFCMRNDTETIKFTPQAKRFFDDHNIPYSIEERDDKKCIRFNEDSSLPEIDIDTIEGVKTYVKDYNMSITFKGGLPLISFL